MTKTQEARRKAFRAWIKARGLTYQGMGDVLGISYGTVMHWSAYGRVPRRLAMNQIRKKYPDCPLLSDLFPDEKKRT